MDVPTRVVPRALAGLALLLLTAACGSVNPVTGQPSFTLFMSPAQEARVGAREHANVLDLFGGVYSDPEIGGYVATVGGRIAANSGIANARFIFTVLNTPDVNAFALPGGYVYVTRGLLALTNSEAELAGVLAHEVGHVAARHTAERYSRAVVAGLGAAILGAVTNDQIGQLADLGSELYLRGFSREQEFQADTLGVRYLRGTGYAPKAMASFLRTIEAETNLTARLARVDPASRGGGFFATHPRTLERVTRAINEAGASDGVVRREAHLERLAGLVFGDDPSQGIVKGRDFAHAELGFRFTVPPGFRLTNTSEAVFARDDGGAAIVFDGAGRKTHPDPLIYLRDIWAGGVRLGDLQRIDINGMNAATGTSRIRGRIGDYQGPLDARFVVIEFGGRQIYRFQFLSPPGRTAALREAYQRTTFSFRRLSAREAARIQPLTVELLRVGPGDTPEVLAQGLPFDEFRTERFLVLNGLAQGQPLTPGTLVKIIAE